MAGAVAVRGLRELQIAFALADEKLAKELTAALKDAAEPIRLEAEHLTTTKIRNILSPTAEVDWWRMRIGVTRTSIYVAPNERGRFTKRNPRRYARSKLAPLLLGKAMEPALDHNQERVVDAIEHVLGTVGRVWEQAA